MTTRWTMSNMIRYLLLLFVSISYANSELTLPKTKHGFINKKHATEYAIQLNTISSFAQARRDYYSLLVLYHSPNCKHCKDLMKNVFDKISSELSTLRNVQLVEVNCDKTTSTIELCAKEGIMGYPTIKHYIGTATNSNFGKRIIIENFANLADTDKQVAIVQEINQNMVNYEDQIEKDPNYIIPEPSDKTKFNEAAGGQLFKNIRRNYNLALFCNYRMVRKSSKRSILRFERGINSIF